MSGEISVEITYALSDRQVIIELRLPCGVTVAEAIARSGITERFAQIDLARNKIGVFGRLVKPEAVLRDGDRIEIYRPLIADPKDTRRRRAEEDKAMLKK